MKNITSGFLGMILATGMFSAQNSQAQTESIQGTYRAVMSHAARAEGDPLFHQYATITLRTVNTGGNLRISASVRMIFGDWNSNEFLTYDYPEVPMNILTRQISIRNDNNDVSFIGTLRDGKISGEWFAASIGRAGIFGADKNQVPSIPADSQLVKTVTGHYRGLLTNTNTESNLPERMTMSLVTTQNPTDSGMVLKISGNLRFYLGDFGSSEYVETRLSDVQFNFYTRYLTVKTEEYGLTLKGVLDQAGNFNAQVFADGLGEVGYVELKGMQ